MPILLDTLLSLACALRARFVAPRTTPTLTVFLIALQPRLYLVLEMSSPLRNLDGLYVPIAPATHLFFLLMIMVANIRGRILTTFSGLVAPACSYPIPLTLSGH
jgi:hypothetical protein